MTFGEILRKKRKSKGLSLRELMDLTGIPKSSLFRYEHDMSEPKLTDLRCLKIHIGLNEEDILGNKEKSKINKRFLKITDIESGSVYYFYQNSIFNIVKSRPLGDKEYLSIHSNERCVQFEVSKIIVEETDTMDNIVSENNSDE